MSPTSLPLLRFIRDVVRQGKGAKPREAPIRRELAQLLRLYDCDKFSIPYFEADIAQGMLLDQSGAINLADMSD
jgi:hypothetical protein